ncbi:lanC-like protein 3 isoform X2 [Rhodnius prolixus]|uniref:lanC-like protein 3 isoform X2 n=1 Tax=Rhodnius prolixus TaxID=13249 RepID=UPI003D18B0E8
MTSKIRKATRLRCFINNLPDYDSTKSLTPDLVHLKSEVQSKAVLCALKQPCTHSRYLNGGLYVGASGIGYMFYHIGKSVKFSEEKDDFLKKCLEIIKSCLAFAKKSRQSEATDKCGFLLGDAGTYAVAAAVFNATGQEREAEACLSYYKEVGSICIPLSYTSFGGDELFVGRAGYICGALWLNKEFKKQVIPEELINKVCHSLVESGRNYAKHHRSPCPLMYSYYGTEYLGAAHGLCAILQMLLSCHSFLEENPTAENDIKETVNYLLSLQTPSGNFPCAMDEIGSNARREEDELIHWCHGAPGVVYLMAKAYLRWKEDKYLNSALQCGEVTWKKGLLKKGSASAVTVLLNQVSSYFPIKEIWKEILSLSMKCFNTRIVQ